MRVLQGVIIIHEVYPDGAAAKDGRLKPGDQILEVNSEDFRSITHSKALAALRQTPAKVGLASVRSLFSYHMVACYKHTMYLCR